MSYLFKGSLCGHLCEECTEPLSDVVIRLYRNRKDQNTTALAVADPGLTLSLNNDDQVSLGWSTRQYLTSGSSTQILYCK